MTSNMRALFETLDMTANYAVRVRGSEKETGWIPVPPAVVREVADVLPDADVQVSERVPAAPGFYAIKIRTDNDTNGNPRRGWLVYTAGGDLQGFADEGYMGTGALERAAVKLGTEHIEVLVGLDVPPREYRAALKHERLDIRG